VKLITIITQTKEFHLPAKNKITESQKIPHQTAKANSIISVKILANSQDYLPGTTLLKRLEQYFYFSLAINLFTFLLHFC